MNDLPLSRRAVTRALLAASATMTCVPASAAGLSTGVNDNATWDQAYARWQTADETYRLSPDRSDEALDPLCDAEGDAMHALMLVPAPNAAIFAEKLRLFMKHNVYDWHVPDGSLATEVILADADRLAKEA